MNPTTGKFAFSFLFVINVKKIPHRTAFLSFDICCSAIIIVFLPVIHCNFFLAFTTSISLHHYDVIKICVHMHRDMWRIDKLKLHCTLAEALKQMICNACMMVWVYVFFFFCFLLVSVFFYRCHRYIYIYIPEKDSLMYDMLKLHNVCQSQDTWVA